MLDLRGRIVVPRRVEVVQPRTAFALARYMSRGHLDSRFGSGGETETDFHSRYAAGASAVALQGGKIVTFGWSASQAPDPRESIGSGSLALARYLPNGRLDPSFGTDGQLLTELDLDFVGGAIRSDGKIVVVVSSIGPFASSAKIIRYLPNGRLDRGFGTSGKVGTIGFGFQVWAVALQSDNKVLIVGGDPYAPYPVQLKLERLARYLPDGRLDASFGTRGNVRRPALWNGGVLTIALQADGKIITGGSDETGDHFALARYTADGRLDRDFGEAGQVVADFGPPYGDTVTAVTIQDDGKIVAGGSHTPDTGGDPTHTFFALARYTSDGQLDRSFGTGGKVVNKRLGPVGDVAIQDDGKLVIEASRSSGFGSEGFVLARYTADGMLDTSFGKSGTVLIDSPRE